MLSSHWTKVGKGVGCGVGTPDGCAVGPWVGLGNVGEVLRWVETLVTNDMAVSAVKANGHVGWLWAKPMKLDKRYGDVDVVGKTNEMDTMFIPWRNRWRCCGV